MNETQHSRLEDLYSEAIIAGETIHLTGRMTETPTETFAKSAEDIMAIARKNNVSTVTFEIGSYKITVESAS